MIEGGRRAIQRNWGWAQGDSEKKKMIEAGSEKLRAGAGRFREIKDDWGRFAQKKDDWGRAPKKEARLASLSRGPRWSNLTYSGFRSLRSCLNLIIEIIEFVDSMLKLAIQWVPAIKKLSHWETEASFSRFTKIDPFESIRRHRGTRNGDGPIIENTTQSCWGGRDAWTHTFEKANMKCIQTSKNKKRNYQRSLNFPRTNLSEEYDPLVFVFLPVHHLAYPHMHFLSGSHPPRLSGHSTTYRMIDLITCLKEKY